MTEYTGPLRGGIVVGDKTTAGGVVIEGCSAYTHHGKEVALNGHQINCPACGTIGHIEAVPPRDIEVVHGQKIAMGGDLCMCGCTPPPRLISSNESRFHFGFSDEAFADPAAVPWLIHAGLNPADYALPFDEQFLLQDATGKPLVDTYYSVKLPDGKVVHGTTNSSGLTQRYKTEGAKHIEVYLGHIGVKFPEPLAWGKTNVKSGSFVVAKSDRFAKPWTLSEQGLGFLAQLESGIYNGKYKGHEVIKGMILTVYDDGKGIPTVGLGHKVLSIDNLKLGDTVSLEWAQKTATKDLTNFINTVNRKVRVPLHQHELDSLVTISFNTGPSGFDDMSTFVNKGGYKEVPEQIKMYRSKGAEWRRALEARLFDSANYDGTHLKK